MEFQLYCVCDKNYFPIIIYFPIHINIHALVYSFKQIFPLHLSTEQTNLYACSSINSTGADSINM